MKISILSSKQEVLTTDHVADISIPTTTGIVDILPGHVPLVSILEMGEVVVRKGEGESESENERDGEGGYSRELRLLINGGVMQTDGDQVTILANEADPVDDLVAAEIAEAINKAEMQVAADVPAHELIQMEKQLRYQRFKQKHANL